MSEKIAGVSATGHITHVAYADVEESFSLLIWSTLSGIRFSHITKEAAPGLAIVWLGLWHCAVQLRPVI